MTVTARRFFAQQLSASHNETGRSLPKAIVATRDALIPCDIRKFFTRSARRAEAEQVIVDGLREQYTITIESYDETGP